MTQSAGKLIKTPKLLAIRKARTGVEPVFKIMSSWGPKNKPRVGICKATVKMPRKEVEHYSKEFPTEASPLSLPL